MCSKQQRLRSHKLKKANQPFLTERKEDLRLLRQGLVQVEGVVSQDGGRGCRGRGAAATAGGGNTQHQARAQHGRQGRRWREEEGQESGIEGVGGSY